MVAVTRTSLLLVIVCLWGEASAFVPNSAVVGGDASCFVGAKGGRKATCTAAPRSSQHKFGSANTGAAFSLRMVGGSEGKAGEEGENLRAEQVLRTLMSVRSKESEKVAVVDRMMGMRQTNADAMQELLDAMLAEMNGVSPVWCTLRWPVPPPSYRAKLGVLSRMMVRVLDGETEPRRQRSAMAQFMRQLSTSRGIWGLEREMITRTKRQTSMKEMLDRTPQDLETPKYTVEKEFSDWEIRNYEKFSVVSAQMENSFGPGTFNALAGYIFGSNKEGVKMKMTTPVINTAGSKMSFIMPSDYWQDTQKSPTPMTGDVKVETSDMVEESSTLAVAWFGGYATKDEVDKRKKTLLSSVEASEEWDLVNPAGDPYLLQYNDPFQPPWKRRNEVVAPVKRRAPAT